MTPDERTTLLRRLEGLRLDSTPAHITMIQAAEEIRRQDDVIAAMHTMLERYASECGECAGVGITIDDQPCTECADIRELL